MSHRAELPAFAASGVAARITIVVPTFNEKENVAALVDNVGRALSNAAWEILFVDDDSPDGTAALAKAVAGSDPRVRCLRRVGRRGLAGACIEGMLASSAPVVAVMDGDLQHDEKVLPDMLALIERGEADVVVASRYTAGGDAEGLGARKRQWASRLGNRLARLVMGVAVSDPMSGFFMMKRDAVERMASRLSPDGFKILFDILATARKSLRVHEVPYKFRARRSGASKLDARNALDFAGLLVSKASNGLIPPRFFPFFLVGLSGIAVHLAALRSILVFGAPFPLAQTVATFAAMTSNFFLNNTLTYRDRKLTGFAAFRGLLVFYAICGTSALSNVGVASWIYYYNHVWWLAGFLGALVGAVWNYVLSSRILWRPS